MAFDLFDMLERNALSARRDSPALSMGSTTLTYAELRERALTIAQGLRKFGVEEGGRVGLMMGNRIEHVETFFALAAIGAVAIPINVLLRTSEATYICRDSDVSALIIDKAAVSRLSGIESTGIPVIAIDVAPDQMPPNAHDFSVLTNAGSLVRDIESDEERSLAHYYTSGTTGYPKGAVHTHRTLLANAHTQITDFGLGPDDTYVVVPSFTWAAGFNTATLTMFLVGGHVVLMSTGSTTISSIIDTLESSQATCVVIAPTLLRHLTADAAEMVRIGKTALRRVFSGAEPLSADTILTLAEHVPQVEFLQAYGLSEFPTVACALSPEDAITHAGSAGRAATAARLAVRDDSGAILPAGTGELLIRSIATMKEYLNLPEETAAAYADGWLNTGDLVTIDDDGYVAIIGRKKDMIISGGLNVYPAEIETVIRQLDGATEVAVVGVPDADWGEVPAAVVVGDITSEDVFAICREHLATFKLPRHVLVSDRPLERTASGKLRKVSIQDHAIRELNLSAR